jgi:hypothetical protein
MSSVYLKPGAVKAAQVLFIVNGAVWLLLAVTTLAGAAASTPFDRVSGLLGSLMLGNAAAMWVAGAGLGRCERLPFFFAIALLAINILLTFTDQVGVLDIATLLLDLALLVLLLATRKRYLKRP